MVCLVPCDPGDRPARPVIAIGTARQVAAQRCEVAAARLAAEHGELRTVRLVEGDVRGRVLRVGVRGIAGAERPRAPHMLETRKDRVCPGRWVRIGNLRPVEADGFATVHERRRDDHPLGGITVPEVRVRERARELVESPCGIRAVVASVAAVSVNHLRPGVPVVRRVVVRPRAVVLRPALDLTWIPWVDGDVNELERVVVAVDVRDRRRHARKHSPTVRQARGAEKAALVRVAP